MMNNLCSIYHILLLNIILATCLTSCSISTSTSNQLKGKVTSIADGDSFTLLDKNNRQEKIRLYGIDCPEKGQSYGNVAKKTLSSMIFGKEVVATRKDKDEYGRIVAIVYVNGTNVNEAMLKNGLAWHFKRYDRNPEWDQLEEQSRKARLGLWSDPRPVAPWKYRQTKSNHRNH